jgi:thioredoxin
MKKSIILASMVCGITLTGCAKTGGNNDKGNRMEMRNPKKTVQQKDKHKSGENKKEPTKLTAELFKSKIADIETKPNEWKFKGDKPAIIDFYATWCGPCRMTAPVLAEIAAEYDGKIDVYKVDIDEQKKLAALMDIQSIPALLFIPMKGQPQMSVGAMNKEDFEKAVKEVLLK